MILKKDVPKSMPITFAYTTIVCIRQKDIAKNIAKDIYRCDDPFAEGIL